MSFRPRKNTGPLSVLVSAGPTREKIDPVRFISNYSTGHFGYEIAKEALRRGCRVTLVSGPTELKAPRGAKLIRVESALEMARVMRKEARRCGCVIMAAAVSDWRAAARKGAKIKKKSREGARQLKLIENPDILSELGKNKKGRLVGFALETEDLEKNARAKLREKNLDLIVANKTSVKRKAFGDIKTDVVMIDRLNNVRRFRRKTKRELAKIILDNLFPGNIYSDFDILNAKNGR